MLHVYYGACSLLRLGLLNQPETMRLRVFNERQHFFVPRIRGSASCGEDSRTAAGRKLRPWDIILLKGKASKATGKQQYVEHLCGVL